MRDGAVVAQGAPAEVVTPEMVREVFGLEAMVVPDPAVGTPMVVPLGRPRA
jgi:iron complex transport system ATP-binding protein